MDRSRGCGASTWGPWLGWIGTLALLAPGCGLFKRGDATSPFVNQLAAVVPLSNLARSSGEVTYLRLGKLFPEALRGAAPLLQPEQFVILTSDGINRSISDESRPVSSLAQIALRKWAAPLCNDHLTSGNGAGELFSLQGIWLKGEAPPTREDERLVIAAMRNGWFSTARLDAPEAKIMLAGYAAALQASGGDAAQARRALCMMTLMAPQFWIGDTGPAAPIRRIAMELGRTLPSFADFDAYVQKKLTIDEYIRRIQKDPAFKRGYLETIHSWHRDWWGLRPYQGRGYGMLDPRGFTTLQMTFSALGAPYLDGSTAKAPDGVPLVHTASYYGYSQDFYENCADGGKVAKGAFKKQQFDPRTSVLTLDQRNRALDRWEVVGAFVLNDPAAKAQHAQAMAYAGADFDFDRDCQLMNEAFLPKFEADGTPTPTIYNSPHLRDYPLYYRCQGRASLPGGGFRATTVHDYDSDGAAKSRYPAEPNFDYYPSRPAPYGSTGDVVNKLYGTSLQSFSYGDRRVSRWAPSGLQDGVDEVENWYSGKRVYACNALARYTTTCAYRPEKGRAASGYFKWFNISLTTGWDYPQIMTGAFHSHYSMAHPLLLNQFRCAKPRLDRLPLATDADFDDLAVYPNGYDLAQYATEPLSSFAAALNPLINTASYGKGVPEETEAVERLREDMDREPYRLLDHVVDNGLKYGELFTADYTFGHEELELHYRSQNYPLPAYPPGYNRAPADAASRRGEPYLMKRKTFPPVPMGWLRGWTKDPLYSGHFAYNSATTKNPYLPPLPTSGVLTMPAFLGPVSQKMRTISARVFTRLLCGEPNIFQPVGGEKEVHRRHMVLPGNGEVSKIAVDHLDESKGCFTCHVGLDPLGAALSANFLKWVQNPGYSNVEMSGELLLSNNDAFGGTQWLGSRAGGEPGIGAFLGQEVAGFEGVGKVLAKSDLMTGCVFRRTFERVYGRPIQFSDIVAAKGPQTRFSQSQDFNQLVRDLVNLKMYSQED